MEFFINDIDAWATWKARLVDDSLDNLLLPAPKKPAKEYKSDMQHGKQVIPSYFKDERTVQLFFEIECSSKDDYLTKYDAFISAIDNGIVSLKVPSLKKVYHLYAEDYLSLSSGTGLRNGRLTVRFCEPDPTNTTTL